MFGDLLSAGAQIGGVMMSNSANKKEAARNRKWQEQMDNTKYQRTMADMREAGINPMMAANLGATTSGSGAQATMQNPFEGMASTALAQRRLKADLKNLEEQNELIKSQTNKTDTDAWVSASQNALNNALIIKARNDADVSSATAKQIKTNTALANYALDGAKNESDYQKELQGVDKKVRFGTSVLKDFLGAASSAKSLGR